MKFGLSFLPDATNNVMTAADYYKNALILSKVADQIGFDTIKMTEHYLHDYGGYCPSPLNFLASVAAVTNTIRLMTGCLLPAFHHPIQIAAETAQVDAISCGRLEVGFARAYLPYEFNAFGIDMDTSRERFETAINAVRALWTTKHVSASNAYFSYDKINSLPLVTQIPHPPIWGAAVNARQSFAWLGENGFGLLVTPPLTSLNDLVAKLAIYREAFVPSETMSKPTIALSMPLLIRETHEKAEAESDIYLNHYMRVWREATLSWTNTSSNDYPGYTGLAEVLSQNTPQKMRDHCQAMVGDPETILTKTKALIDLLKIDQLLWQIDFGAQPLASSMKTISLFNQFVQPQLN